MVQQKNDLMQPQKRHKFEEAHAAENQKKMVLKLEYNLLKLETKRKFF